MENFFDILTPIGNFLNSYWFPLCIAIVCIVVFATIYFKVNQIVDKYREEVQQKIIDEDYVEHTKKEREKTSSSQDKRN